MRKRQLPFPEDIRDPRNNLQPDTEVIAPNQQGGADAVETACVTSLIICTPALSQRGNSWGREPSGIWRAGTGPGWNHFRYVTAYFCSWDNSGALSLASNSLRFDGHRERGLPAPRGGRLEAAEKIITFSKLVDI